MFESLFAIILIVYHSFFPIQNQVVVETPREVVEQVAIVEKEIESIITQQVKETQVETKQYVNTPVIKPIYIPIQIIQPLPVTEVNTGGEDIQHIKEVSMLEFTVLPQITATTTEKGLVRHIHYETNIPATSVFYVGQSPRDIGYTTESSTIFDFDYEFGFDYYHIEIKSEGQTKIYQDRCDGSPTCFNPARAGDREYIIF